MSILDILDEAIHIIIDQLTLTSCFKGFLTTVNVLLTH